MRFVMVGLLVSSAVALAQPPPPPAPEVAPAPTEGTSMQLRAGLGFGRYSESGAGWKWKSDLQPFVLVGAEGAFPAGRGHFVMQAQAGLGSEVHMTSSGDLMQENDFHQQIFEGSPRYRHPLTPTLYFEGGYRFTMQRLFFTNIPTLGDARETVTLHALEFGIGWRRIELDGAKKAFALTIGLNRGSAENSRITGEDFSAGGTSLNARAGKTWASGLGIEGQFAYRKQSASDPADVEFDGMATTAYWPKNVTWQLLAVIGLAL
jgi:hypothetical protein